MFDIPAPTQARGIEAYKNSWEVFSLVSGLGRFQSL